MSVPLLTVNDMDKEAENLSWVVKHCLPASSVGTVFGASGTFKSFLALDLALHVVYGLPWLGLKTMKGEVVYLAAEGGLGLLNRIKAWHLARNMDWRACPLRIIAAAVAMRQDAGQIVRTIENAGIRPLLLIVDTLAQTYSGDENDAAEVSSFYRILVASFSVRWRCSVVVVHHTGHSATERPRGSSAIVANSDFLFGVFRSEASPVATLECQKQKDGGLLPPVSFKLDTYRLGIDPDGDHITSLAAWHIADPTTLASAVHGGPDGPKKRLIEASKLGLPVNEARKRFYTGSDCDTGEARKKEWQRTLKWATESNLVKIADGLLLCITT